MSEFTPAQLDAVEDALEELEDIGIPASLLNSEDPGDMEAAARLGQFRDILALSRDALPLEDVPDGALDAVFAEARASVHTDAVSVSPPEASADPWWKRVRMALMIPAVAVAGSTVLILWMVTPKGEPEDARVAAVDEIEQLTAQTQAEPAAASEQVADGRLADAAAHRDADEQDPFGGEVGRGNGLDEPTDLARGRLLERGEDAPPPPAQEVERNAEEADEKTIVYEDAPPASATRTPAPRRSKSASGSKSSAQPAVPTDDQEPKPAPKKPKARPRTDAPEPAPGAASKGGKGGGVQQQSDDPWTLLGKADAARRRGSCGSARAGYREVESSEDRQARARALAGLGLCEDLAGNAAAADSLYRRARALDSGVSKFIDAERAARGQATVPKAAPSQNKKK